ncbi:MAG: malto-oligosyltrehalose trehalohydrolase [Acidiphilium sp.]|nr:malto-oligosyltrehalose trehalohydrolase [Acidiphilium sp.]MDD4936144.1 malto-oligosyltrehalose trehalohydrolase [Acidiphilium sp.]
MTQANQSHPNWGVSMLTPDRACFTIWAPGCSTMALEIEGNPLLPMRAAPDGYFMIEAACTAGACYRFVTDTGQAVADPASRLQAGDVHDASVVVDAVPYEWQNPDWRGRPWHEAVIYELHPGACGGYAGIETMLPRLAKLGITAVELMPIADFPGRHNWGYDGVLPYAPDTAYGTPDQLRHMIDTAHGLDLMVFLDVVYNHFGPDGNYLHAYAPQFFRDDIKTPWGSAIDYRRDPVRRYFIDNAIYWLKTFQFDGLRFDAVHAIHDNGFLATMATEIRNVMPPQRHVHLVLENDDNNATLLTVGASGPLYDAQWADDTHHCLHVLLTGEQSGYYEDYPDAAEQLARCLSSGFAYQGEASPHRDGERRGTPSGHLPPTAFVAFLQNHDQIGNRALGERLTTMADPHALRAAILLLLLSPQIPLIFMGEEFGETRPFLYFTDHQSADLAEAVRQGRRREFAKFAAFSSKEVPQNIPDPNDPATFTASVPTFASNPHASSWFEFYAALLEIRHKIIMPRSVGARSGGASALGRTGVRAVWHMGDGMRLIIAANFGSESLICDLGNGTVLASSRNSAAKTSEIAARTAIAWLERP